MRDCTRCGGFGEYAITEPGPLKGTLKAAFVECPDCDGFGVLPEPGQAWHKSMIETLTSTAIGFFVSLLLVSSVLPAFGYPTTAAHDFWITVIFTLASVVRGYFVRRLFERHV